MTPDMGSSVRAQQVRDLAAAVTDPEMPMLTLADLGVLRDVQVQPRPDGAGPERVIITITPTYSGCPAMATMRDDLVHTLQEHGFDDVEVRVSLHPAWSSDWISARGRRALNDHGISAPGAAARPGGPIVLNLLAAQREVRCPRCGADHAELSSEFGATACKAMYRCASCLEPFEHVKEI